MLYPQFVEGTSTVDKEKVRGMSQKLLSPHPLSNCVLRLCLTLHVIFPSLWRDKWRGQGQYEGDILKKILASLAKLFVPPPTFKLCFAPLLNAILCYIPNLWRGQV